MDKNYKKLLDKKERAKQNYKGQFCCLDMDLMLENEDQLYNVQYNHAIRQYALKSLEGPYIRTIEFCPWCGAQLMKCLKDEWFDILEKEYGLDNPAWDLEQRERIPAEFLTNEWWKKRGL